MGQFRNELHEEDNADYSEQVRDTVSDCNHRFVFGCELRRCSIEIADRFLSCGKARGGRQSPREYAVDKRKKFMLIRRCMPEKQIHSGCDNPPGKGYAYAYNEVGFIIFLKVFEEFRPCHESHCGYEKHQADVFNDLECILCQLR